MRSCANDKAAQRRPTPTPDPSLRAALLGDADDEDAMASQVVVRSRGSWWRGGKLGGPSFTDQVPFNPPAFTEGVLLYAFFPLSLLGLWAVHGEVAVHNFLRAHTGALVVQGVAFVLLVAVNVGFVLLVSMSNVAGTGDIAFANLTYLAQVVMVSANFAFLSEEDRLRLHSSPTAPTESLASAPMLASPSPALVANLVARAQELLLVDASEKVIAVCALTRENVRVWEGEGSDEGSDEGKEEGGDEGKEEGRSEMGGRGSDKPTLGAPGGGGTVTVLQAACAVITHATLTTPHHYVRDNLVALVLSLSIGLSGMIYRHVSSADTPAPFGTTPGGATELALVVVFFIVVFQRVLTATLALITMSRLRRRTYGSLRTILRVQVPTPGFALDDESMAGFLWVCKLLRRVGSLAHVQLDLVVTVLVFVTFSSVAFFVVVAFSREHEVVQTNVLAMGLLTIVFAVLLIQIIFVGANANLEHEATRQIILEAGLHNDDPRFELLADVLTHMDTTECVSIVGVRCTKGLITRLLVVLGSVFAVVLRFFFSSSVLDQGV